VSALARLYSVSKLPTGKVSIMPRPRGGDWLADEMKLLFFDGVDILVSLLTLEEVSELNLQAEADFCQKQGIIYLSYPIPDHHVPSFSTATFALLEELHTYLAQGKHIAVHCRMGLGRSALIAASVLVLSNMTPARACKLLSVARGYQVPETEEQRAWVRALSQRYQEYLRAKDTFL
jgi:protein-tyrosine phosphatase